MKIDKKQLHDYDVKGQRVLIRADLNAPLNDQGEVAQTYRIKKAVPTIEQVIGNGGIAVVASHLGRPSGKTVEELKMNPVARALQDELGHKVEKLNDCVGDDIEETINNADEGSVFLLENLRFHAGETDNDDDFARNLAYLADVYVNDAFATSHREHTSIVGVPQYIQQSGAGMLMKEEIEHLSSLMESPEEPFVLLAGGKKLQDKIHMIQNLLPQLDTVLLAGAMSYPFLKAKEMTTGEFDVENQTVSVAEDILEEAEEEDVEIIFPKDHLVTNSLDQQAKNNGTGALAIAEKEIELGWWGGDIGPDTIREYQNQLKDAGSVFWNGPTGIYEIPDFQKGSELIGQSISDYTHLTRITGGGDTAAALEELDLLDGMDHVSTGGGALIQFLDEQTLPGIEALPNA